MNGGCKLRDISATVLYRDLGCIVYNNIGVWAGDTLGHLHWNQGSDRIGRGKGCTIGPTLLTRR